MLLFAKSVLSSELSEVFLLHGSSKVFGRLRRLQRIHMLDRCCVGSVFSI